MGIAAAQTPEAPTAESAAHAAGSSHLRGGWYPWDPYQYREYRHGVSILTGFDVEIERALARIMRVEISLPPITWEEHLAALADGRADIASGATASEERSAFTYVSKPYRTETDVLILPKGAGRRYSFRTVEQMLEAFAKQRFRLGVIAGYAYADARVNAFIAEPANRDQIVTVASDADNLQNLLDGVIDGFLADRVAANTTAWRNKQAGRIEEHPLRFSTDIHFLLSRATQTPQMLARLDAAIDELKASGEFRRIADVYALPVLITSAQPLWLWGPIAAVITASFGGLMRDLYRHDRVTANLGGELYRLRARPCRLPGLGGRTTAAGRDQDRRDRDHFGRVPDPDGGGRARHEGMALRLNAGARAQYPAASAPRVRGSAAPTRPVGATRIELADVGRRRTMTLSPRASSAAMRSAATPGSAKIRSGIH